MEHLELYTYCKSSASYRVRIALNYKNVDYQSHFVDLLKDSGKNATPAYMAINSQGFVPTLVNGQHVLQQSVAILEYIEEKYPSPPLLPNPAEDRAYVRAITQMIACDIHPLNNLRVLAYLESDLELTQNQSQDRKVKQKLQWYQHWIKEGFTAIERFLQKQKKYGQFCFADTPSLADACLVPQVFNANRYDCDLIDYPIIMGINEQCLALHSFQQAAPIKQTDFIK